MDEELTGGAAVVAGIARADPGATPGLTALQPGPTSHRRRAPAPAAAPVGTRAELRAQRRRKLRKVQAVVVVGLLVLMTSVRGLMFQAFSIPSPSMEPTLLVGDRVLVNKMSFDVGSVQRGQIVVFDGAGSFVPERTDSPGLFSRVLGFLGLDAGEDDYVKRVIGLPGDRVVCCDVAGHLQINNVSLDEPYLFGLDLPSQDRFDVLVPPGRLWVMGDHRSRSADSRAHLGDPGGGTVPLDKVVGRAVAVVWPLGRAGWLPIPESFERLTTNGRAPSG